MKAIALLLGLLCMVGQSAANVQEFADSLYFGGDILTMAGDKPAYIEALAIRDGKIIAAGKGMICASTRGTIPG